MTMAIDPVPHSGGSRSCALPFIQEAVDDLDETLQSLAGKLMHVSKCCPPARRFTARILDLLRRSSPSFALTNLRPGQVGCLMVHSISAPFQWRLAYKTRDSRNDGAGRCVSNRGGGYMRRLRLLRNSPFQPASPRCHSA